MNLDRALQFTQGFLVSLQEIQVVTNAPQGREVLRLKSFCFLKLFERSLVFAFTRLCIAQRVIRLREGRIDPDGLFKIGAGVLVLTEVRGLPPYFEVGAGFRRKESYPLTRLAQGLVEFLILLIGFDQKISQFGISGTQSNRFVEGLDCLIQVAPFEVLLAEKRQNFQVSRSCLVRRSKPLDSLLVAGLVRVQHRKDAVGLE